MLNRRFIGNGLALFVSVAILIACCVFGGAEDKQSEIYKDGEFEVPKVVGGDVGLINRPAEFKGMMKEVLEALVDLKDKKNKFDPEKISAFVAEFGAKGIECTTRVREPFMIPVFDKLLDHEDWWIRRLAIFGLQRNVGLSKLDRVAEKLMDESFLVREIAAMTIAIFHSIPLYSKEFKKIALWTKEEQKALKVVGSRKSKKISSKLLEAALKVEKNPYVRSAIEASISALGKFKLNKICNECTVVHKESGITYIPRVGKPTGSAKSKSGGNSKMKPSTNWCYPVSVYPHEIIRGISSDKPLVPLTAKNNSLHFGHDCAWMMDGAGVYAIADGQLRTAELAGDFGVLIIGEYMVEKDKYVTALNGHSGIWVFANPGPIKCRQLLGSVGLGFSLENGIHHAAHNHFGMRSTKYDRSKCFGRGAAGTSTKGWLIPADFLGPLVVGEEINPDSY